MSAEVEKAEEEEKPSELTMDTELLRKTCNYALIKVGRCACRTRPRRPARARARGVARAAAARPRWLTSERLHALQTNRGHLALLACASLTPPPPCAAPCGAVPQNCDMNEEMRQDCIELVITAIEKYQTNYEVRTRRTAPPRRPWGRWCGRARGVGASCHAWEASLAALVQEPRQPAAAV
jgi:hypothetical protein